MSCGLQNMVIFRFIDMFISTEYNTVVIFIIRLELTTCTIQYEFIITIFKKMLHLKYNWELTIKKTFLIITFKLLSSNITGCFNSLPDWGKYIWLTAWRSPSLAFLSVPSGSRTTTIRLYKWYELIRLKYKK